MTTPIRFAATLLTMPTTARLSPVLSAVVLIFTLALGLAGCAKKPDWQRANAKPVATQGANGWDNLAPQRRARRWSGGVSAVAAVRPFVPNAGLQLPRVSPDGKWIAFFDADADAGPVSADARVTGRGLAPVSLWLREVEADGLARNLAVGHAAWPAWSPDGNTLAFISHDPGTGCALALHDVAAGRTDRLSVGLRKMFAPAVAPDGRRVAVAGYGEVADQSLLFVIDLDTAQATPGPPPVLGGAQLMPVWLDADTLLFVELDERGGGLMRWAVGSATAEPVAPLGLPASVFDAVHLHAGIPAPVSPDRRWFAYYCPPRDRIELIRLDTGDATALAVGDRAGTWWGDQWFLAANDGQLTLVQVPEPSSSDQAAADQPSETDRPDGTPRIRLLPGRWAPRWADPTEHSMLLVGQGETPGRFELVQLWAVTR